MPKALWVAICFFLTAGVALAARPVPNYKSWDNFPDAKKAPRITADLVKNLMNTGAKMVFIYAGYKAEKVICGSRFIPYTAVPPNGDGAKVNFKMPKDTWIMVY